MVKRVYSTPTILKVQLSHEQAVLRKCSVTAINISASGTGGCQDAGCRMKAAPGGTDAAPTS